MPPTNLRLAGHQSIYERRSAKSGGGGLTLLGLSVMLYKNT
jgi:hypothetical protein